MRLNDKKIIGRLMAAPKGKSMIEPHTLEKQVFDGLSWGVSQTGYDVRVAEDITIYPVTLENLVLNFFSRWFPRLSRPSFLLASTIEKFDIPNDLSPSLMDKSTWIRRGISVHNTILEPGWRGFLTLEIKNVGDTVWKIRKGTPIGQIVLDETYPVAKPYNGKYQNQKAGPQEAKVEN